MGTRFVLVRHGSPQHHERGITGGPLGDLGLTETGRDEVTRCARRLAAWEGMKGAPVYCSTLPRARESAAIIARVLDSALPVEHCGLCSYHVLAHHDAKPPSAMWDSARRGAGIALYRPEHEGGDSFGQLVMRAADAYHEIAANHFGDTVVIVCHNETIQASLVALGDLSVRHRMQTGVKCGSISEWQTSGDTRLGGPADHWVFQDWSLVRWNDTGHLEGWFPGEGA